MQREDDSSENDGDGGAGGRFAQHLRRQALRGRCLAAWALPASDEEDQEEDIEEGVSEDFLLMYSNAV